MTNATDQKGKTDVTRYLNKFNYPELAVYVFSYLGVFDDVRLQILGLIAGQSEDWLYELTFLHESVIVPCYAIGKILAKKHPIVMPEPIDGKKPPNLDRLRREADHKYTILGFLLSFEMVVDYFKIMQEMTKAELNKIDLHCIFPLKSFQEDGNIFVGNHTRFTGTSVSSASIRSRSPMVFEVKDYNKLSPVFKVLPHVYLRTKYEALTAAAASEGDFARPCVNLNTMFDQGFWGKNWKHFSSFASIGPKWVTVPKALLPSFWWDDIVGSHDLIKKDVDSLLHDCILVSANYSAFHIHQTNMEALISSLYEEAVEEATEVERPESPPGEYSPDSIRHNMPFVDAPRRPLQNPGLIAEPHLHPVTMGFSNQPGRSNWSAIIGSQR